MKESIHRLRKLSTCKCLSGYVFQSFCLSLFISVCLSLGCLVVTVLRQSAETVEVFVHRHGYRHELSESKAMQEQFSQHVVEQDITIKQLQSLQDDTQKGSVLLKSN